MDPADVLGGRYSLVERLGEGGMSVVWRAHDEVLRRPVAVKLLSSRFLADWASRERIRAEAQAVARLAHPHVAGVYDYGESGRDDGEQVPYVVMELLNGPSLAQLLEHGPLPARPAMRICAEVAAALSAAHAEGIVHRDVKPANVILTTSGAKVVDFGVAAVIGDLSEHNSDKVMYGTPAYVAPERLEGGPVVPGTDVYALGLLLYRMLTGEMPWSAETTTQMLLAHVYVEPRPVPPVVGVPDEVLAMCRRCLAKDPKNRPSAAEFAQVLAQAAGVSVRTLDASGEIDLAGSPVTSGSAARDPGPRVPAHAVRSVRAGASGPDSTTDELAAKIGAAHRRGRRLAAVGAAGLAIAAVLLAASGSWPGFGPSSQTPPQQAAPAARGPGQPQASQPEPGGSSGTANTGAGAGEGDSAPGGDTLAAPPVGAPPAAPHGGAGQPTIAGPNPPPTTPQAPPTSEKTIESPGGTIVVRCTRNRGLVTSATPAAGFRIRGGERGPGADVNVRFVSATQRVTIRARCANGVITSRVDVTPINA